MADAYSGPQCNAWGIMNSRKRFRHELAAVGLLAALAGCAKTKQDGPTWSLIGPQMKQAGTPPARTRSDLVPPGVKRHPELPPLRYEDLPPRLGHDVD